jgi:hypothetical protein
VSIYPRPQKPPRQKVFLKQLWKAHKRVMEDFTADRVRHKKDKTWEGQRLTEGAIQVHWWLADKLDQNTDTCYVNVTRLVKLTGLSREWVRACLGELKTRGYIWQESKNYRFLGVHEKKIATPVEAVDQDPVVEHDVDSPAVELAAAGYIDPMEQLFSELNGIASEVETPTAETTEEPIVVAAQEPVIVAPPEPVMVAPPRPMLEYVSREEGEELLREMEVAEERQRRQYAHRALRQ